MVIQLRKLNQITKWMNTEKIIKLGKNASYSNPTKKAKSDYESG